MCITERERFLVPVKAIGARGLLDFPDEVHFGICPVKSISTKILLIRNIGNTSAKFDLLVEKPYFVTPDTGILDVGKSMQIELSFDPQKTKGHKSDLVVQYETGEEIYVRLHGDAIDVNVRIDKNTVRLDNTYISSASRRSVSLVNRSDLLIHFSWKTFATASEEEHSKKLYYHELNMKNSEETDDFLEECMADPSLRDKYSLLTRSLKNKIKVASDDKMLFNNENIIIEPLEGDIWPNSSFDVNVIFKPTEAKSYSCVAYCDVTGRETRLPLRLRGEGVGPKIQFSFDTLNVENIFINSSHCYEIILANKGDIDAGFEYVATETLFGKQFIFLPDCGVVKAGDYQAIQIHFTSPHLGQFFETFYWTIEGSPYKSKFNVRGCVIGPTFHFDQSSIKFGSISYGFTYEKSCKLINTSLIPMTFKLHVPSDGVGIKASTVATSFLEGTLIEDHDKIEKNPIEFEVFPSSGTLLPSSKLDIQIQFTPLSIMKYETILTVDIEGVGKDILSLPISARAIVPPIQADTPILDFGRCFINYPYERIVELSNESNLAAKYELVAQVKDVTNDITYSSTLPRGIIEANSTFQVPLDIITHSFGEIDVFVYFTIFGSSSDALQIHVRVIGEGPVVHIEEKQINYGTIPVLTDSSYELQLTNESLIPADFYCEMVRPNSLFRVEPASARIPPEANISLKVTANINDNIKFQDKLAISVVDSRTHTIQLAAQGSGTTIVAEPQFGPVFDIGPQFSNNVYEKHFRFYNRGRRLQQIYWMTEGFAVNKIRRKQDYNTEDMKYKNMPPPAEPPKPVFKLIPDRLSLGPGKYQNVILQGFTKHPQKVKERMICQSIIGNSTGKEKIMLVDVIGEFIQPLLEFSDDCLQFTVVRHPFSQVKIQTKKLTVTNTSMLPLSIILKLEHPFSFDLINPENESSDGTFNTVLEIGENLDLFIQFDPSFVEDSISRSVESKLKVRYANHPNTDEITLKGDVFYPNLTFESQKVDFQSVLNNTEHIRTINVTNNSPLDVAYMWSFSRYDICFEGKDVDEGIGKEISDLSSDEEQTLMSNSQATTIKDINTGIENSFMQLSTEMRSKSSMSSTEQIPLKQRPSTAPASSNSSAKKEPQFAAITKSQMEALPLNVGIEEVFDVLPLYGTLKPAESQQLQFTFYGHTHIIAEATALCSIKGGPDYEINLKGQASLVQYHFSAKEIDFGRQLYDQITDYIIRLKNTGKVELDFFVLKTNNNKDEPHRLAVNPSQGIVPAGKSVEITVSYMPGIPEEFARSFEIRVAHFQPDTIRLRGIGVFQRITLSLPRDEELPAYQKLHDQAQGNLTGKESEFNENDLYDWDIQSEIDRLLVKQYALKKHESQLSLVSDMSVKSSKKSKLRPSLIDYVLDFGHVIVGQVLTQICQLTNVGYFPVSFYGDHKSLVGTGFYINLDRVKGLPGFPANEFVEFQVVFNPASANLSLGPLEVLFPIKMVNGPIVNICLRAYVTVPDIQISVEQIDFSQVVCGQCKVVTIQMSNITQVRCDWEYEYPQEKTEIDRHVPMHLRKKMKQHERVKPKIFEIMPPSGTLVPGQKINVQVKFMPIEEVSYTEKLLIKLDQSLQKHTVVCTGVGKEPHIDFDQSLLKFGPILPYTGREELTVTISNPCPFPIEFYSLEFDRQYLEEEKVIRSMKGFDEFNLLLLPPRVPGEPLPKQLLDYYEESKQEEEETVNEITIPVLTSTSSNETENIMTETSKEISKEISTEVSKTFVPKDESSKVTMVGELEITPVSAAIANYLGIDLSVEGKAARNRRGICIIVHGAPLSGKTATALDIANQYQATLLTIDSVVLQALEYGTTSAAVRARELCQNASKLAKANADVLAQSSYESKVENVANVDNTGANTSGTGVATLKLSGQNRKASVMPPKAHKSQPQQQQTVISPQAITSTSYISRKLDIKCNLERFDNDEEFYSCVMPDELLVELLAERFQFSDCHYGIVIDGLESIFSTSVVSMTNVVLRAINNRKYIYAVTLKFEYDKLKEINAQNALEEERQKCLAEKNEWTRLEEMSEDEYNALPEEEREAIDKKRLEKKKQKLKRRKEIKEQQERERREKELLEEKRLEEEKFNKKNRKNAQSSGGKIKEKRSNDKVPARDSAGGKLNEPNTLNARPDTSLLSERSGSVEDAEKKRGTRMNRQKSAMINQITSIGEHHAEEESEDEAALRSRFKPFEDSLKDIFQLFDTWDRTIGTTALPEGEKNDTDVEIPVAPSVSMNKKTDKKKVEKERLKEISESPAQSISSLENVDSNITDEAERLKDGIGVPNILVNTVQPQKSLFTEVLEANILPGVASVMDGMGLGPSGPPVPPDAIFSVVPFPAKREAPSVNELGQHYVFVFENETMKDEKSKSELTEVEKPVDKKESRKHKGKHIDRQPSASVKKGRQSSLATTKSDSPPPIINSPDKDSSLYDGASKLSLDTSTHRWVVQPGESTNLKIAFTSQDTGQFDQTLNFEIVGTRRRYQLFCRGVCSFPVLSREPRIVFPNRKKFRKPDEIVHKKYILSSETFEFGPLLAGKNRERYREGRYPENMEKISMSNTSPMPAHIYFSYLNDPNATTFLLEPSTMVLQPGENQILTIWAYPKTPGFYEDSIVCCVKENPEPILFKISAHGVRPELELDRKLIQFDRVLLHRKETRTMYLRNSTLLPVAWKMNGMENLGDDFSLTVDHGIIEPMNEFGLQLHFRAIKPVNVKKIVRLEVSDCNNILGLSHAENITVQAEAFDVALDMSFPKGADGGLDFGTMRVGEESKQTCTLKNKGRYEIAYHFIFENGIDKLSPNLHELFTVIPNRGSLIPSDRPTAVQVMYKSKNEIALKDLPILKCQIIELSMGENGEVIASIPVKISAKSVYSKYSIYPVNDINFGAILINSKKTRSFIIENKSEFDFRYHVAKMPHILPVHAGEKGKLKGNNALLRQASRQGSLYSGKSQQIQPQKSRRDSVKGGESLGMGINHGGVGGHNNNVRLQLGMFTIFPASGVVLPGSSATITVDMFSEIAMVGEEEIVIDITERAPDDHPNGIEYRLFGEACIPSITSFPIGIPNIFEEHRIVKNLNVFRYHAHELAPGSGVFGEDENKFIFYNVIVGYKVKARFKIANPNKVSCDVVINLKPISNKLTNRIIDIFDVEPPRTSIPAHSHIFATVTFQPPSMQTYSCIFEALVEGLSASVSKGRNLTFEIQGDGNLPRISVLKPNTTNKNGSPIIIFNKLICGRSQSIPIIFKNDGTLPCKVNMKLTDPNQSFTLHQQIEQTKQNIEEPEKQPIIMSTTSSKPFTTTISLAIHETCSFLAEFHPNTVGKLNADFSLSIMNNPFEDTTVQLIGECHQEEVTIDNIQSSYVATSELALEYNNNIENEVPTSNQLIFGDCYVNTPKNLTFTITNHSKIESCRFYWEVNPNLTFAPSCGHLLPGCAKDITATFCSQEPNTINAVNVPCHVSKIILPEGNKKVSNWDDRRRVIRWVDANDETDQKSNDGFSPRSPKKSQPKQMKKKKVVETEEEPPYSIIPGKANEIELVVFANCNYANYQCKTDRIYFKDTYMFQTRVFSFSLANEGSVVLDYSWRVQPGIYHLPTVQEEDEIVVKSGKASRKGVHPTSSKSQSSKAQARVKADSIKKQRTLTPSEGRVSRDDSDTNFSGSRLAHTVDGRPASAMTLAYEAGGVGQPAFQGSDVLPFTIEPGEGSIAPGKEATFTVRFSPLDVNGFNAILSANIVNLDPGQEKPFIALYGKGSLPWCHFELEESNYIQERRNPELRGPSGAAPGTMLDKQTKVIEFKACGVKTKLTRNFVILNPTDTAYNFVWTQESLNGVTHGSVCSNFTCLTPKGSINPGKKTEIGFEYDVESLELTESFWRFTIVDQNVSVPFLLVAHGNEPNISFDRSHINFKQLLIGHNATEVLYILNDEEIPLSFYFEENSRFAAGHIASLRVEPMKGTVPPKSKFPVKIFFKAESEADVNFNLSCRVKKKTSPLAVNVKAEGFAIKMDLVCEDSLGNRVKLSTKGVNVINFGDDSSPPCPNANSSKCISFLVSYICKNKVALENVQVEVNEKAVRQIFFENNGRFNLDFTSSLTGPIISSSKEVPPPVTITPDNGTVLANNKRRCQLAFCPSSKLTLKNCNIDVKILNGPSYHLSITGNGIPPLLEFSFTSYNFGPCFIYRSGLAVQKKTLTLMNKDTKEISLDCHFTNTSYMETTPVPNVFQPGEKRDIEIRFYPRELKQYSERIAFEINGLSTTYIDVSGQGVEMRVEVDNPSDRKVNIGSVPINEKVKRPVRIVNKSLASIDFSVTITPFATNLQNFLSILPNSLIQLKPKASCDVLVQFQPKARIAKFTEEVILECAGLSQTLFTVTGACQGLEIKLDSDAIPFGTVTLGSSSSRKLIMVNSGDIGSSFEWNIDRFQPSFNISPVKGYISPGMEVPFEIEFTPKSVSQDIRCDDLRCALEGVKPLKLVLTGSCIAQLPMKEIIHFSSHVRNRDTKSVTLHNKTNQLWTLRPVIDGEYWTGSETFIVEPLQSKNYEIVYRPLTMTQDLKKHNGSVFFALPDGSGLLYNLVGNADPPKPVGIIQRDVPCKMTYAEMLNVSNWLRKPQRFRVSMELIKPEKPDPATSFKGLDYIDIPGLSKKEYKVQFYAHKEGTFSSKVTFKNEHSGEYQFYYLTFRVSSPGAIGTIDLSTPVRQSVSHVVTISNPLLTMVNFQTNCNLQDVNLPPQLTIPPQSEGSCTFEYMPLKSGTVNGRLVLQSVELGGYIYDLNLVATSAAPERPVHFITTLGTSQQLACRFTNYSRTRVEYSCKVDSPEFSVEKTVNAASAASGGIEISVDVTFEPSRLGDAHATLTVSSSIGGEYQFPIFGHCLPPKPQGPYTIKAGNSTQIPFKNIFSQTTTFAFHIDNPSFSTKAGETIRAKKTHNLVVSFDGNQGDSKAVRMGRLVITCARSAGTGNNLSWTFYLKGVTP